MMVGIVDGGEGVNAELWVAFKLSRDDQEVGTTQRDYMD